MSGRDSVTARTTRWDGALDAPSRYQVKGQLTGLSLAARASDEPHRVGRPGLRNASLQLTASEKGGSARLDVRDGAIDVDVTPVRYARITNSDPSTAREPRCLWYSVPAWSKYGR